MFLGLWHESQSWQHWMYEHYELNANWLAIKMVYGCVLPGSFHTAMFLRS